MAEYRFVTEWRLEAPIEDVYAVIHHAVAWPEWWDAVLAVDEVRPGDERGLGAVHRYTFKGKLPYHLKFETHVDRLERPVRLGGSANGELTGRGDWTLEVDGDATRVRYEWVIRTTRPWMNALAKLPFARRMFEDNHDFVMERGLVGIRQRLGI